MPWPSPSDYNDAVQNPHLTFNDVLLKGGRAEEDQYLGLPKPNCGNFAVVYKIITQRSAWAVKCFTTEIRDQQERYFAISKHLEDVRLPYTVPFTYLKEGVRIQGKYYPLLKMEWVQGESLTAFVGRSVRYATTLMSLAKVWIKMMADLRAAKIAHGDLQHGNIVVVGDQLRLLDYDGMYVPGLAGRQSNECGHRNYQLPSRSGSDYGPYLDNFSAWVIYVSLVSLSLHPELWDKHNGGDECLLFRKEDFVQPNKSALLRDLNATPNPRLRILIELFVSFVGLLPQDVPSLDGDLTQITVDSTPSVPASKVNWWTDHTGRTKHQPSSREEAKAEQKEEIANADIGWIIDTLLEDQAFVPVLFKNDTKDPRLLLFGSMSVTLLIGLFFGVDATELIATSSCVLGLNIVFCYIRYRRDPSTIEGGRFDDDSKILIKQLQTHQSVMDAIQSERVAVQEVFDKRRQAIEAQKNGFGAALMSTLSSSRFDLNSQLQLIADKRRSADISERTKKSNLHANLGRQIAGLDAKLTGLKQEEVDDKSRTLKSVQDTYVKEFLRNRTIWNSSIPGIGEAYKTRLARKGFTTAADIDYRVRSVQGIGQVKEEALIDWKRSLENAARKGAPILSAQEVRAIENKYAQDRQMLEAQKQQQQSQLDTQIAEIEKMYSNLRASFDNEERTLNVSSANRASTLQQEHDQKVAKLCNDLSVANEELSKALRDLSRKLSDSQKGFYSLKLKTAKRDKQRQQFASIKFWNYLQKVVSS